MVLKWIWATGEIGNGWIEALVPLLQRTVNDRLFMIVPEAPSGNQLGIPIHHSQVFW